MGNSGVECRRIETSISTTYQILHPWEEAVGKFYNLASNGGRLLADIGPVRIYLPLELEGELRSRVGRKTAILRTDDPVKPYRIRDIKG